MVLPIDLADSLNALSRQERVSLFMVLLAGFKCLLHRYSNHAEIGIGSCGANRGLTEVQGLIGRFGNAMLLRTSLAGNPTFRELLMRVRETAHRLLKARSSFWNAVERGANGADPIRKPPFQVMFILQNAPQEPPQVQGLSMNWSALYAGTAAYDLDIWLKTEPELEIFYRIQHRPVPRGDDETNSRGLSGYPSNDGEISRGAYQKSSDLDKGQDAARLKPVPTVAKTVTDPQNDGAAKRRRAIANWWNFGNRFSGSVPSASNKTFSNSVAIRYWRRGCFLK